MLSCSALPVGSSSRHRVWQSRSGIEGVTVVAIVSVVYIALDVDRDDHFVVAAPTVAPVAKVLPVALEALVAMAAPVAMMLSAALEALVATAAPVAMVLPVALEALVAKAALSHQYLRLGFTIHVPTSGTRLLASY